MQLAPILLFVYNRPENTRLLLESLKQNKLIKDSVLYIYADGAKKDASGSDLLKIQDLRKLIYSITFPKQTIIIESDFNIGCGPSIANGVTTVVNKHGKVIVLEDDLKLSPFFLEYMNDALLLYKNDKKVSSIGGCNFFACGERFPPTFFIPYPDCWGWGTWKDRWQHFEHDAKKLHDLLKEKKLIAKFNSYGAYDMEHMLLAQSNNQISAWDIQWTATCFLNDWLTLYPNPSITQHIYNNDSTHAAINVLPPLLAEKLVLEKVEIKVLPEVFTAMQLGYSGKGDFYGEKIEVKKTLKDILRKAKSKFKIVFQLN